jgi:acetyltransferase-like isoleucine patch superfamily enzyme
MLGKLFYRFSRYLLVNEHHRYLQNLRKRANVQLAENIHLGPLTQIHLESEGCLLSIKEQFYTRSFCMIRVGDKGKLTINKNVFWNNNCSVNCMHAIEIGENVMFGEGVRIYDHDHEIIKGITVSVSRERLSYGKVVIGKNSWLGTNVTVLKGVTIGENVVIGAHCLIYKDIPSNSIVKSAVGLDIITIAGQR